LTYAYLALLSQLDNRIPPSSTRSFRTSFSIWKVETL